ncbi:PRD domain-containing protein [uncultured Parolsenella sp.]|uniref:PRD domain-containing protein n=1 Tax=uncultured Parolsenella sp. TaxID=2083008 RepID=UPI0025F96C60|nr:PRD domain-containing protein [uncultured Parolsenella sp.]
MAKTSKERVYDILDSCTRKHDVRDASYFQASSIADALHISRSLASQYMNELVGDGLLVKVASRPALFYSRSALESNFGVRPSIDSFVSVDEMLSSIQSARGLVYDFEDLIGAHGSLRQIVERAKAAAAYPPCGLPLMLVGGVGSGRRGIENAITKYCVSEGIIVDAAHAGFVDAASNGDGLVLGLLGNDEREGLLSSRETRIVWVKNAQELSDAQISALLSRFETRLSDGGPKRPRRGTSRLFFEYNGDAAEVLARTWASSIPALCFVPALDERGTEEKESWIFEFLRREEANIGKPIKVSQSVIRRLVSTHFVDNIDGLKRTVSLTCASAMADFDNQGGSELKIYSYHVPGDAGIARELEIGDEPELLDVDLYDPAKASSEALDILGRFMALFSVDAGGADDVEGRAKSMLSSYFEYVERDHTTLIGEAAVADVVRQVFDRYGMREPVNFSRHLVASAHFFRNNQAAINRWRTECGAVARTFFQFVRQKYATECDMLEHLRTFLRDYLGWRIDDDNLSLFSFYLHWYLRENRMRSCQALIVAHGHSTASSIADSVNTIIGEHVFDAVDMPVDVSADQVVSQLERFLSRSPLSLDALVMVDMGSLEHIGKHLSSFLGVSVGVVNNVSTALALEAGEMIVRQEPLEQICEHVCELSRANYSMNIVEQANDCILFVSENGEMAATRISDLFIKSLPRPIPVEMVPCDYFELIRSKGDLSAVTRRNVLFVFGASNPGIEGVSFMSLEGITELKEDDGLALGLENYLASDEISQLKNNLIRNCSIENLMHHLTILEPNHLMDAVSESVDALQASLDKTFSYQTRLRLYIHVSYLVERLVTKAALNYGNSNAFAAEHADFVRLARTCFSGVTHTYGVDLPVGEINYLFDLIELEDNGKTEQCNEENFLDGDPADSSAD